MSESTFTRAAPAPTPPPLSRHAADTARLAAPLAIAQLSQMAMGVTDTILLGSLSADALAAGGLGAGIFFVIVTLLQGVLSSVSVTVGGVFGMIWVAVTVTVVTMMGDALPLESTAWAK